MPETLDTAGYPGALAHDPVTWLLQPLPLPAACAWASTVRSPPCLAALAGWLSPAPAVCTARLAADACISQRPAVAAQAATGAGDKCLDPDNDFFGCPMYTTSCAMRCPWDLGVRSYILRVVCASGRSARMRPASRPVHTLHFRCRLQAPVQGLRRSRAHCSAASQCGPCPAWWLRPARHGTAQLSAARCT